MSGKLEGPWFPLYFGPEVGGPNYIVSSDWPAVIVIAHIGTGNTNTEDEKAAIAALVSQAPNLLAIAKSLTGDGPAFSKESVSRVIEMAEDITTWTGRRSDEKE